MTRKIENLAGILFIVLWSSLVGAQDNVTVTIDSVPNTVSTKKAIEIPAFQRINTDTIALGENDMIISDSYTAQGQRYVYDALHSFNSRKMDHFGGYLNVKINEGLAEIRQKGFNSDVKKLYIQIDPATLTVFWTAVVGPSTNGKCCVAVDSRGSAGGGLPAVLKQCPRMHNIHAGLNPELLLDFNDNVVQCYDWNGVKLDTAVGYVNIQQHFYKYYDPQIGTTVSLAESVKPESTTSASTATTTTITSAPAVNAVKKAPASTNYRKYKVKSGDTLSEIAEKYHTSIAKIKKANSLRSDMIQVGQTLKIPG
jgi:LysM repeat protein